SGYTDQEHQRLAEKIVGYFARKWVIDRQFSKIKGIAEIEHVRHEQVLYSGFQGITLSIQEAVDRSLHVQRDDDSHSCHGGQRKFFQDQSVPSGFPPTSKRPDVQKKQHHR